MPTPPPGQSLRDPTRLARACRLAVLLVLATLWLHPARAESGSLSGSVTDAERTMEGYVDAHVLTIVSAWLKANPHRELVLHVNSGGGLAAYGAAMFQAIREHGHVATDVGSGQVCISACVYLWLAGQTRTMAERAALGFHSAFCTVQCDGRAPGVINQSILDILARTEPALAVLVSTSGAMMVGNGHMALARRQDGHWLLRTIVEQPHPPPEERGSAQAAARPR